MTPALLRLLASGGQGQNTRTTVFPLNTGRWSFIVWCRTTSHFVRLHRSMVSRMKRSVASFVLLLKSMYGKKRNCTICRDEYSHRVFLLCSRTDPLHSQHHGYQRQHIFAFYEGSSQLLSTPYKQGGWGGSTPGVALWRHGTRPRCHTVSIAGEDGSHLDTRRMHLGTRRRSRRDLDNHGLPAGFEILVRRREKTARTGEIRG
jgi:hypothetical protein